ncbi:MAG: hypothetical protein GF317_01925 [Candidatus Lokiarchaeota archaeon]|nr:hypothetical protein [Candidatus Lokiarchaeota archaeon]MBD3198699.1 hypothetical protein [Candidatus Lokiarchaeota archaeon]
MNFLYIGHRGERFNHDENTFSAFQNAVNFGANCLELDIRITKDQKLVVFHDENLERMTGYDMNISNLNFNDLKKLRTSKENQEIPLLREVLDRYNNNIFLMIELKVREIEDKVIFLLESIYSMEKIIISGRDLHQLIKTKKKSPKISICYNITKGIGLSLSDFLDDNFKSKKLIGIDMINLRSTFINKEFIDHCHKRKIKALAWDFIELKDPIKIMKKLVNLGVNGILFDDKKNISIIKKWNENRGLI